LLEACGVATLFAAVFGSDIVKRRMPVHVMVKQLDQV